MTSIFEYLYSRKPQWRVTGDGDKYKITLEAPISIYQGFSVEDAGDKTPVILRDPREWTLTKPTLPEVAYPENTYM